VGHGANDLPGSGIPGRGQPQIDWVDESSEESFPASDSPAWPSTASTRGPAPQLTVLVEEYDVPVYPLNAHLEKLYGGPFSLRTPCLFANFVSTVDGVVALGPGHPDPGGTISGHSEADRFVMALLRTSADTILVGAGTLRATPGHRWTPEDVYPSAAADFADLRRGLRRSPRPRLVVVSSSGDIDVDHPALQQDALILTNDAGAQRLRGRLPAAASVRSLGAGADLSGTGIVEALRSEGCSAVLTEGGPTLIGHLLRARVLDELFLTVSPLLAGQSSATRRPGLVDGVDLAPAHPRWLSLLSVRRDDAYLFLRYRLRLRTTPPAHGPARTG
jgi:riboflavin biosynthesis pyrimidine reductase